MLFAGAPMSKQFTYYAENKKLKLLHEHAFLHGLQVCLGVGNITQLDCIHFFD